MHPLIEGLLRALENIRGPEKMQPPANITGPRG